MELISYGGLVEYSNDFVEINIDIQNISERIIADIPVKIINVRKIRHCAAKNRGGLTSKRNREFSGEIYNVPKAVSKL